MGSSPTVDLLGTAAAPIALGVAYTGGNTTPIGGDFNQATLYVTIAGFDATSTEILIQYSDDGGTTWFGEQTEEVAAGIVTHRNAERRVAAANGTYALLIPLTIAQHMRVAAKRTGGSAATTMHVTGTFGWVG